MKDRARDQLIILQRSTSTQDEYGEETPAWATLGQEWAAVYYGRGDERRQAAMEQGRQPANFQMMSNALTRSALIKDQIVHDGSVWDVVAIAPDTPKRGDIEFTAVRAL